MTLIDKRDIIRSMENTETNEVKVEELNSEVEVVETEESTKEDSTCTSCEA